MLSCTKSRDCCAPNPLPLRVCVHLHRNPPRLSCKVEQPVAWGVTVKSGYGSVVFIARKRKLRYDKDIRFYGGQGDRRNLPPCPLGKSLQTILLCVFPSGGMGRAGVLFGDPDGRSRGPGTSRVFHSCGGYRGIWRGRHISGTKGGCDGRRSL